MVHNFFNGKLEDATKIQLESIELISALFSEVNPIPVKEALNIFGYNFGTPRLPLTKITDENRLVLEKAMKNYCEF